MDNKTFEQTYLQQLEQQAPINYVWPKYTEQQAHVIVKEFWNEFKPKLPDVMQTLFAVKPKNLTVADTHTMRAEFHAVYEVKCGYHKWVKYNISYQHTENIEYGYQDYSGNWHHAYTRPETSYSSESSGGMASRDRAQREFYERKTDSPILHRWTTPNEKTTFDCSGLISAIPTKPYSTSFNGVVARPSKAAWDALEHTTKILLVSDVRSQLQEQVRGGTVGFSGDVVTDNCTVAKSVILWPFYFADFKVGEHTFTVRIDAANGFVNLYLDNPQGIETETDVTNSRLQAVEKREGKQQDRESQHNKEMSDLKLDEDKLGKVSLICGICSLFVPVILTILSIYFGVKSLKYADEGRGKAIAGIVIASLVLLLYAFYFIGGFIIQLIDPEASAQLLTLPLF